MEIELATFEEHFDAYLALAESGEDVDVIRDGLPTVRLVAINGTCNEVPAHLMDADCPICKSSALGL